MLAIVKPRAFGKVVLIGAIGSAGPISFAAVSFIAKLLPASQPVADADTASASTDASVAVSRKTVSVADPTPPKPSPPHPSNPFAKVAKEDAPACLLPGDVDKFDSLRWANRDDLALKLDCVIIPQGAEVIPLDSFADLQQVIWEKDGKTIELWSRKYNFRYNFTRKSD
ncbi:hypothetical protein EN817_25210 [Mesorhizobium sp. M3A.F.Ca.ET.174.01.1.1]|uniref:hypothetical protein n=1 Tax=unclassified Mesorhizobium TaxID=325217 RepID=UPI0010936AAD|nr:MULTISPECIES: hypothetical protein [unclassified Mesorhizobium]TGS82743.1 hypothetical protein EN818_25260 [Mesorhizobium sp. M3A.F.Ca.ET.175.01.1.1]TGT22698.1 hypothetical protein EN817_25210 [Mesorhizobium sp. M3A.F.Ca.ET.174.01.1.1]